MRANRSDAKIFVTFQRVGFHRWQDAVGHRHYLYSRHRHIFHVRIECFVSHDDREIEFHDLIDQAAKIWDQRYPNGEMGITSCEQAAAVLGAALMALFDRNFDVSVSEDGECGAMVTSYKPLTG